MATITEVQNILDKYNIADTQNTAILNALTKLSVDKLDSYVNNCIILQDLLDSTAKSLTLQQIYSVIIKTNNSFLAQVENEFLTLTEISGFSNDALQPKLHTLLDVLLNQTNKTDAEIATICEKYLSDLDKLKKMKLSLSLATQNDDIALSLLNNCLKRMQTFLYSSNIADIEQTVLYCLNQQFSKAKVKPIDLVTISERCASFFANATAEKIDKIQISLSDFSNFILGKLETERTSENELQINQYQTDILTKDFRTILLSSPSIFAENPNNISFNLDLIMGTKSLGELVKKYDLYNSIGTLNQDFENMRLNLSVYDLHQIYINNLSSLTISPVVLINTLNIVHQTAIDTFGPNKIDISKYLSAATYGQIPQIFKHYNQPYTGEGNIWKDNLKLLSKVMPKETLQTYFLSNFKIATIPTEFLKKQIVDTILKSNSVENLQKNINRLANKNFFWDISTQKAALENSEKDSINNENSQKSSAKFNVEYRIGNRKQTEIEFAINNDIAGQFLQENGYNQQFVDIWKQNISQNSNTNKEKSKTQSAEIDILNMCNELLNYLHNNRLLLNENSLISDLEQIKYCLSTSYNKINELSQHTHQLPTAVKGYIVNIKKVYNDLSNDYNTYIKDKQQSNKQEIKKLNKEYILLKEKINKDFEIYQRYKNQAPKIQSEYFNLVSKQSELTQDLYQIRSAQQTNTNNKFKLIEQFGEQVNQTFEKVCKITQAQLEAILLENNYADYHYTLLEEDCIAANVEYICKQLSITDINLYTGHIFKVISEINLNPNMQGLYNNIKLRLEENGINLDAQLNHAYKDRFHGEALSMPYIKEILGENISEQNIEIIRNYNGILNTAWKNQNYLEGKAKAVETEIDLVKEQLEEYNRMIFDSSSNKANGLDLNKTIDEKKRQIDELNAQLDKLNNLQLDI